MLVTEDNQLKTSDYVSKTRSQCSSLDQIEKLPVHESQLALRVN